jgi:hypothetical protein
MQEKTREAPEKKDVPKGIAPLAKVAARKKPVSEGISGKGPSMEELRCRAVKGDVHYSGSPEEDWGEGSDPDLPEGYARDNES